MTDPSPRTAARKVLVLIDLAGYAAAFETHDDAAMAAFTQAYYALCVDAVERSGGRVVKFIGDACLAVFPEEAAASAVEAVRALRTEVEALAERDAVEVVFGANLHLGDVVEGLYGPGEHARYDVIGAAMNDTARMGRGGALHMSRVLLDRLPETERARWIPESGDVFVSS